MSTMIALKIREYKYPIYNILLSIAISWTILGIYLALGGEWYTPTAQLVGVIYMFGPLLSTAIVVKVLLKSSITEKIGLKFNINKWWFIAWLVPLLISFLTLLMNLLIPGFSLSLKFEGLIEYFKHVYPEEVYEALKSSLERISTGYFWYIFSVGLIYGPTIYAVVAFGEEAGWRGYLYETLSRIGLWKYSLLIGLIWGIWHLPLIPLGHNYPIHRLEGMLMMVLYCVLLSPLFTTIRRRSNTVISAAILHGSFNGFGDIPILLINRYDDLIVGLTGFSGLAVLGIINLLIYAFKKL